MKDNCVLQKINESTNSKHKIYDIFMFDDEFDLLDLKLEELDDFVDYFIIIESNKTHSGLNKELNFKKNKDNYIKYEHKIIHLICDFDTEEYHNYLNNYKNIFPSLSSQCENMIKDAYQRDFSILSKKVNFDENDIIIISDLDEIINKKSISNFLKSEPFFSEPHRLEMHFTHYFLNTTLYTKNNNCDLTWTYATIIKFKFLNVYFNSLSHIRQKFYTEKIIKNAGWHFSYVMSADKILKKIKSGAHADDLNIRIRELSDIKSSMADLEVFYDKNLKLKEISLELLPDSIKNNKSKWLKYLYSPKDLLVIGCYPNSKNNEDILIECINSLSDTFDIVLVSHFPIHEKIQKLVKYVIYDKDNQHVDLGSLLIWQKNNNFNYQVHVKNKKDYSYSILKNIFNCINLLKNKYESFYYIEYDCIVHPNDIQKFKNLKNKNASFFIREDGFLHTICFYLNINFFIKNVPEFENISSYLNFCKSEVKDKYPVLEHFLYSVFLKNNVLQDINLIKDHPRNFFTNSEMDIQSVPLNEYGVNVPVYIVCLKNENRLFLIYLGNKVNKFTTNKQLKICLNDIHLFDWIVGEHFCWSEIFVNDENFSISVNDKKQFFNKTDLFNDKLNYIEFK